MTIIMMIAGLVLFEVMAISHTLGMQSYPHDNRGHLLWVIPTLFTFICIMQYMFRYHPADLLLMVGACLIAYAGGAAYFLFPYRRASDKR